MSDAGQARCPRCNATVQPGQEYCLECGNRLVQEPAGPVARASTTVAERHDWAGTWLVPALLGLVIAVLGTGAAIAISGDGEEETAIPTATGGSLTVTGGTPTLTAPEPTTAPTATTAPTQTTAPPPPPANPAAITWPAGERGWTIFLLSLPQANGRDAAAAQAKKARDGGLRRVGILDSSRYASLHPGYYVVFQGVYADEAEASSTLQRARAVFPSAYQREIVP
jgi:cell division septation protein DedD